MHIYRDGEEILKEGIWESTVQSSLMKSPVKSSRIIKQDEKKKQLTVLTVYVANHL